MKLNRKGILQHFIYRVYKENMYTEYIVNWYILIAFNKLSVVLKKIYI